MPIVKLSSKGQLIIPASLRAAHHWQEGAEFLVEEVPEGLLLRPRKPFSTTRVSDGLACVGYTGPAKTIDEMDPSSSAMTGSSSRTPRDRSRYQCPGALPHQ